MKPELSLPFSTRRLSTTSSQSVLSTSILRPSHDHVPVSPKLNFLICLYVLWPCYISGPSHSPWYEYSSNVQWRVQVMKVLTTFFFPVLIVISSRSFHTLFSTPKPYENFKRRRLLLWKFRLEKYVSMFGSIWGRTLCVEGHLVSVEE